MMRSKKKNKKIPLPLQRLKDLAERKIGDQKAVAEAIGVATRVSVWDMFGQAVSFKWKYYWKILEATGATEAELWPDPEEVEKLRKPQVEYPREMFGLIASTEYFLTMLRLHGIPPKAQAHVAVLDEALAKASAAWKQLESEKKARESGAFLSHIPDDDNLPGQR